MSTNTFQIFLNTYTCQGEVDTTKLKIHDEDDFLTLQYGEVCIAIKKESIKILYKAFIEQ